MRRFHTLIATALWLVCATAQAQWQWLDHSGRKVFSDQAPPANIPPKNILKQPGKASTAVAVPPMAPASASAVAGLDAAARPKIDEEDKYLTERKKKADAEALAKVKADADRIGQIKASNCETEKARQTLMDSGVRVSITNAKGEPEVLDDAGRAAEQKKIRAAIEVYCK